jgi:putative cell wall-binding protein
MKRFAVFVTVLAAVAVGLVAFPAAAHAAEPGDLIIVGGPNAVSVGVESHIEGCTPATVFRIAGRTRYDTAAAVADEHWTSADTVFIATGVNFPDALSVGPAAAAVDAPVLLTHPEGLPEATLTALQRLGPTNVIVVGGPSAVGPGVEEELASRFPSVTRLAGTDRYETAAAVSEARFASGASVAYVATGASFVDALVAGPRATVEGAPLLLTDSRVLPPATAAELARLAPSRVVIVGSIGVVDPAVASAIADVTGATVERLAGGSRHATAAEAAALAPPGPAYIVTANDYPDGLAAIPAAAGQPILLVGLAEVHDATAAAISRHTGSPCEGWVPPYPLVGEGKRIIYSNSEQQVWLIDENEQLYDTYAVSGRQGIPGPGTYSVFSKSVNAWAPYGGITMKHMVRFAWGTRWAYGFHSIPRYPNGQPLQTEDELGTFRSGGCVRQADLKAEQLFDWTPVGTTVIVLP